MPELPAQVTPILKFLPIAGLLVAGLIHLLPVAGVLGPRRAARVQEAARRALAGEPAARFPSMESLRLAIATARRARPPVAMADLAAWL